MSTTNYEIDVTDDREPCLDGYSPEHDEVMAKQQKEARKAMESDEKFESVMNKRVF